MKALNIFPRDRDTLDVIAEMEVYLGLRNKNIDEMKDIELIEYIDQITLMVLNKKA